jgi:hypothetical protein
MSALFDERRFAADALRTTRLLLEAHNPSDAARRFHLVVSRRLAAPAA